MTLRSAKGFTLIELMIVVAIVAIMAAIAYPAYTSSVLKGKRAQGRTALAELLQQQERYMTQRNTYLAYTTDTSFAPSLSITPFPFKTYSSDNTTTSAYRLSASACTLGTATLNINECVQVVAAPVRSDPDVATLTLTTTGVKDCAGTAKTSNFSLCWP